MTEALTRLRATALDRPGLELAGTGAVAAAWAGAVGLAAVVAPVLVVWAADPRSGAPATDALRAAAGVWLVAQRAAVSLPAGRISLAPLGVTALLVLLFYRACTAALVRLRPAGGPALAGTIAAVAVPYGVFAAVVALLTRSPVVATSPVGAGAHAAVLAAAVGAVATARATRWTSPGVRRNGRLGSRFFGRLEVSTGPAVAVTGAAAGLAAGLAGGALVVAGAVLGHAGRIGSLAALLHPGVVGAVGLVLLDLALLPNAVVAAVAYGSGAGFAVGRDSLVAPLGGHAPAALPALPLLGAVPGPHPGAAGLLALAVPILAGVVAGLTVVRRCADGPGRVALLAAGTGVPVAAASVVLGWLAGGAAGTGRLAAVGARPLVFGLMFGAEVAAVAAGTAALNRWQRAAAALRWVRGRLRPGSPVAG